MHRFGSAFAVSLALALSLIARSAAPAGAVSPARVNGAGSSYVALAVQQWVADGQSRGLPVNYLPTSSPDGLTSYADGLLDFAATEAEYSALYNTNGGTPADSRGFQYVPDVAGATGVMYHVQDQAGRDVDYLHLSMRTIARIFMGDIKKWSDPAITADNKGLVLPDQPITVVYRSGQSGTTGTFYDFVAHVAPDLFGPWAAKYHLPTNVRIIQLDGTPDFAPKTIAFGGSDQVVQYISSGGGLWSIGYDEFGYALVYGAHTAWVKNASGRWVLPYAENISAALESAKIRKDLSQELSGVYASPNPLSYPISAYSYLVAQCRASSDRPTCKGAYPNAGVNETLVRWMHYIACDGQISMARIGYSPLPPNLSQEIENSIARMTGAAPLKLTPANCSNPRFHGSLGANSQSPGDPLANVRQIGNGSDNIGGAANGASAANNSNASSKGKTAKNVAVANVARAKNATRGAGKAGADALSAGGGSGDVRRAAPTAYDRPGVPGLPLLPVLVLIGIVALPPIGYTVARRFRRSKLPTAQ